MPELRSRVLRQRPGGEGSRVPRYVLNSYEKTVIRLNRGIPCRLFFGLRQPSRSQVSEPNARRQTAAWQTDIIVGGPQKIDPCAIYPPPLRFDALMRVPVCSASPRQRRR